MDHDRLFKELLTTFFAEFLELFFPRMAAELDRDHVEFLDKEVFDDLSSGDRHEVDLLAKVRLHSQEAFILVHMENQSTWQGEFPRRMFKYFSLLTWRLDLPVFPIAVFSYDRPLTPAADIYSIELFGSHILRFQFQAVQLNQMNWRDFLDRPNPVASALMTKMKISREDRPRVKLECLRMLLTLKLDPAKAELIAVFMKSYLKLTAAEKLVYDKDIQVIAPEEREVVMKYTNEWFDEGHAKGLLEGEVKGRVALLLRQLRHRIGEIPAEFSEQMSHFSDAQLDDLAEALLDFQSLADVRAWFFHA